MGRVKHAWIVRYLLKEKNVRSNQSNTALFEKDLALLVIANVTVFSQTEPSFSLSARTMHVIPD